MRKDSQKGQHGGARVGAGRKPGIPMRKLSITIPEELYDFVDIERMRNEESRSAFIARVLEAASKKSARSKRK